MVNRDRNKSNPRALVFPNRCSAPPEMAPEIPALFPFCSRTAKINPKLTAIKSTFNVKIQLITVPPISKYQKAFNFPGYFLANNPSNKDGLNVSPHVKIGIFANPADLSEKLAFSIDSKCILSHQRSKDNLLFTLHLHIIYVFFRLPQ